MPFYIVMRIKLHYFSGTFKEDNSKFVMDIRHLHFKLKLISGVLKGSLGDQHQC